MITKMQQEGVGGMQNASECPGHCVDEMEALCVADIAGIFPAETVHCEKWHPV